jgi:hypothetical protein
LQISLRHIKLPCIEDGNPLTESAFFNLLGSEGKHGEQFDHYLYDYINHRGCQRDIGIDPKAFEEVSDAFKQVNKGVVARADTVGCLEVHESGNMSVKNVGDAHRD